MEQFFDIPKDVFTDFINQYLSGSHGSETGGEVVEEAVSAGQMLGDAGMVVLIGLVVVIATLLVLTGIFYLFGYIMDSADRKAKKAKEKEKAETSAPAPAPVNEPAVQDGISGEVVAAIAAAVAMMAPEGKRYAVKSISRKDAGGRSAWAAAGIADNTRPF